MKVPCSVTVAGPLAVLRSGHGTCSPATVPAWPDWHHRWSRGGCCLADIERKEPVIGGQRQEEIAVSRFIVHEPGSYLLSAEAPAGHEISILIDGADVGIGRSSYVGPWSRRDIDGKRDLARGAVVTTMPEDAQLIVRSLPGQETVYDSHGGSRTSGPD